MEQCIENVHICFFAEFLSGFYGTWHMLAHMKYQ